MDANKDLGLELVRRMTAKGLGKDRKVILYAAGDCGVQAAKLLSEQEYTKAYAVTDGFEGDPPTGWSAGRTACRQWLEKCRPALVL